MKPGFLILWAILFHYGCESSTDSLLLSHGEEVLTPLVLENYMSFKLNDTLTLAFSDTLCNSDENIWVTFDSLMTDSRCPMNVVCFWEGNAQVLILFSDNEYIHKIKLNTYHGFVSETDVLSYNISLVDVLPYPHTDSLYVEEDYRVHIVVKSLP